MEPVKGEYEAPIKSPVTGNRREKTQSKPKVCKERPTDKKGDARSDGGKNDDAGAMDATLFNGECLHHDVPCDEQGRADNYCPPAGQRSQKQPEQNSPKENLFGDDSQQGKEKP